MLAFHLVLPTLVTMIFPKRGKFNVTDKGGLLDVGYFDFTVVRPHLVVACLLALGVVVGIVRAIGHDYFGSDPNVIALNVGWGIYSLIFLLAAIAVARETRQVRKTIRIDVDIPVVIHYASGIVSRSHTADLSMGGCRVVALDNRHLEDDIEEIELILQSGLSRFRPSWSPLTSASCASSLMKIFRFSRRRELVRVVLARADAWINPPRPQDNPFPLLLHHFTLRVRTVLADVENPSQPAQSGNSGENGAGGWDVMKRLTTLALLAGMLSAPALHSEEPGSGSAAPLSFPQLNDAADSEPGDEPPAASPEEGASPAAPATAGDAVATAPAPVMPDLPPPVSGTAAPEVIPVAPVWGGDLNLAQMGMPDGIILSGGQRQGGVSFTLPADQVVIHSQLSLAVRVSPEMASRNAPCS